MMKILHIQSGDLTGGAARGALWLHLALLKAGVSSKFLTQSGRVEDFDGVLVQENTPLNKVASILYGKFENFLLKRYPQREKRIFSLGFKWSDITGLKEYQEADIVHLHWINGMISLGQFPTINKPVVWTFRDMWPFTGGCHYSLDCKKYETGCGACPQLKSLALNDLSQKVVKKKKGVFRKNIHPVAISHWLKDAACKSEIFRDYNITVIPNGVDTKIFQPLDKSLARKVLGLPDKKIILTGSQTVGDFYKGFDKFLSAVPYLDKDCFFVFFGRNNAAELKKHNIPFRSFGFLNDDLSLRLLYSAADVFVAPSIQEAFGKTLIEAMACGTPVVCFDATGPKDIVVHKETGYKAKPFDERDLAEGVNWVMEDELRHKALSANSRAKVMNVFDINLVAGQYRQLYQSIK